jgi:hypothetical protein
MKKKAVTCSKYELLFQLILRVRRGVVAAERSFLATVLGILAVRTLAVSKVRFAATNFGAIISEHCSGFFILHSFHPALTQRCRNSGNTCVDAALPQFWTLISAATTLSRIHRSASWRHGT